MAFQTTSSEFSNMRPTLMTPGDIQCNFYTNSNPTPYMVTNPSWASPRFPSTDQLGHWQNVSSLGPIQVTNNHGSNTMPIGPNQHLEILQIKNVKKLILNTKKCGNLGAQLPGSSFRSSRTREY